MFLNLYHYKSRFLWLPQAYYYCSEKLIKKLEPNKLIYCGFKKLSNQ